ncbi:MAG: circadian clock protein KaiC [Desulfobulbaceae bacterium]|jgi:circadian clock protein KaiC|nr:circadian clock protein KaiC [Desulfobulbaceae bacterium]
MSQKEEFMPKQKKTKKPAVIGLTKCPTGIQGLDEITGGGLPQGRPTLVCGSAGCGKTVLAMEFLLRGVLQYDEPGVFMCFEETEDDLVTNFASLGFDLNDLIARKMLAIDYVQVERSETEETGEFDLEGLFVRLEYAINSVKAKRVVLDTVEGLFAGFTDEAVLRAELRRLFRWLKDKGVTAIITGEQGEKTLTRYGLEEYVADCVISLAHGSTNQIATRRMRIVKYRGSLHGTNDYPFLIDEQGISVLPVTSTGLDHPISIERISTGIPRLDTMFAGEGYYRGSSILVSGTAGTGKTSIMAAFIHAACGRGERCLFFVLEESAAQIIRNMRSIGIDLEPWVKKGLLRFHAARPSLYGLEMHLVTIHKQIKDFKPAVVAIDPISNLLNIGTITETKSMITRLIDFLKADLITGIFTNLTHGESGAETDIGVSSLMDTWLLLRDIELNGERNRALFILKSRGMNHSNQVRELVLTDKGVGLNDVYVGAAGVLTGSARMAQEAREKSDILKRTQEFELLQRDVERKRKISEAQITAMRTEIEAEEDKLKKILSEAQQSKELRVQDRLDMGDLRGAD